VGKNAIFRSRAGKVVTPFLARPGDVPDCGVLLRQFRAKPGGLRRTSRQPPRHDHP
jgi:hypothetical protein